MLTRFGFRGKIDYLCPRKEERALNTGVLSSFWTQNRQKKGCFTSDVEKFLSESGFSLSKSGFFLGVCGKNFADIEDGKLKYIYFSGRIFNSSSNY